MRPADIASLALVSLWQQRGRTLLTLVGVVIGSLILLFSLAARRGVQEAVVRVFSQGDELRRIEIWPSYYPSEDEIPRDEIEPQGQMSPAKRERIRKMLVRQWQQDHQRERRGITRERLTELESMDHVAQVVPDVFQFGWSVLGEREAETSFVAVPADNVVLRERVVAGSIFPTNSDEGVLIHEFLAYRWGATSEKDLQKLVGETMRLEVRFRAEALASTLAYRSGREMNLTQEEIASLNRAFDRLPKLLEGLPLPEDERAAIHKAFTPGATKEEQPASQVVAKEFVIRGVFRGPTAEEEEAGIEVSRFHRDAQVILPIRTATDFYFSGLDSEGYGLFRATVIVDDEAHLRPVSTRLRELGYTEHSLIQLVERIHSYVSIITGIFAAVAGVALFVAAVGITNTMIMSVLERTHEIGVMKSVGASDRHVLLVFLTEGILIGILGAVLSIAISLLMSLGIDWTIRWILEHEIRRSFDEETVLAFSWWMFAVVVAVAGLITMLAAVIPARRAARISPVTALRHE
jgi:putative ABC transport system permease protein